MAQNNDLTELIDRRQATMTKLENVQALQKELEAINSEIAAMLGIGKARRTRRTKAEMAAAGEGVAVRKRGRPRKNA